MNRAIVVVGVGQELLLPVLYADIAAAGIDPVFFAFLAMIPEIPSVVGGTHVKPGCRVLDANDAIALIFSRPCYRIDVQV